jgi:hypothetical protein
LGSVFGSMPRADGSDRPRPTSPMAASSSSSAAAAVPPPVPVPEILQTHGYLVIWQVEGEKRGTWIDYNEAYTIRLEHCYNMNPRGSFVARPGLRVDFEYNTLHMYQQSGETKGRRVMRRVVEPLDEYQSREASRAAMAAYNEENWTADRLNQARWGPRGPARPKSHSRTPRPASGAASTRFDV